MNAQLDALRKREEQGPGLMVSPWFYAGGAASLGAWYCLVNFGLWLWVPHA